MRHHGFIYNKTSLFGLRVLHITAEKQCIIFDMIFSTLSGHISLILIIQGFLLLFLVYGGCFVLYRYILNYQEA